MESISWSFVVAAVVGVTSGKLDDKMSDGTEVAAQRFFLLLQAKSPELAKQLGAAEDMSVVNEEIVEEVKQVAENDPEMRAVGEEISQIMIQQFG